MEAAWASELHVYHNSCATDADNDATPKAMMLSTLVVVTTPHQSLNATTIKEQWWTTSDFSILDLSLIVGRVGEPLGFSRADRLTPCC